MCACYANVTVESGSKMETSGGKNLRSRCIGAGCKFRNRNAAGRTRYVASEFPETHYVALGRAVSKN
jgi:hypothetical protein